MRWYTPTQINRPCVYRFIFVLTKNFEHKNMLSKHLSSCDGLLKKRDILGEMPCPTTDLIENGNFQNTLDPWIPSGSAVSWSNMVGQTGTEGVAAFVGVGDTFPNIVQCYPVTAGQNVSMRGYFLRPQGVAMGQGSALYMKVECKDAMDNVIPVPVENILVGQEEGGPFPGVQSVPQLTDSSDPDVWIQSDIEFIAPENTVVVCFIVIFRDNTFTEDFIFASNVCGGVSEPVQPLNVDTEVVANTSCFGTSNGVASAVASGGVPPYSFVWSTDPQQGGTDNPNLATDLPQGTFFVDVTDAEMTMVQGSVQIVSDNPEIFPNASGTDPSTAGATDGSVTADPTGGTGPFLFEWFNDEDMSISFEQTVTDLGAGQYTVEVQDSLACTQREIVTLADPAECDLAVVITATDPTGPGATDGTATAEVTGGTPPFTYEWKDDMGMVIGDTQTITDLGAGTYTVIVADANECEAFDQVTLSDAGECDVEVRIRKACQCDKKSPCYEAFVTKGRKSVDTKFEYVWEPTGIKGSITCHPVPGENTVIVTRLEDGCEAAAAFNYKPARCDKKKHK